MNGTTNDAEQRAFSEREKFVTAFNETMLKIWKEQMLHCVWQDGIVKT